MTYSLVTVASVLNPETLEYSRTVKRLVGSKFKSLNVQDKGLVLKIEDIASLDFKDDKGLIVAVATGGTEKMIMKLYEKSRLPLLLVATSLSNSLAASLEAFTALKRLCAISKIIYYDFWEQVDADKVFSNMKLLEAYFSIKNAKIGLIGDPSPWLVASNLDAEKIKDRFSIKFFKIELKELYGEYENAEITEEDREKLEKLVAESKGIFVEYHEIEKAYKMYKALKKLVEKYRLDGLTIRCFDVILQKKVTACLALSLLNSEGIVAGCEGDQQTFLTMFILSKISGEPSWMANPVRINKVLNELFLAHCTIPLKIVKSYKLKTHYETGLGVGIDGKVEAKAKVTMARVNEDLSKIFLARGLVIDSSMEFEKYCRTQLKIKVSGNVEEFVEKSFGNHLVVVLGDYEKLLRDFAEVFNIKIIELSNR